MHVLWWLAWSTQSTGSDVTFNLEVGQSVASRAGYKCKSHFHGCPSLIPSPFQWYLCKTKLNFSKCSFFRNAYHGMSPQTMGLTSLGNWHYQVPRGFGVHNSVNPDVFRGPWGGKNCRDSPVQVWYELWMQRNGRKGEEWKGGWHFEGHYMSRPALCINQELSQEGEGHGNFYQSIC